MFGIENQLLYLWKAEECSYLATQQLFDNKLNALLVKTGN